MRLTIIITCLLLLLLSSACAAPAQAPWAAPDRELITSFQDQKYYFIRSSVRMYPEAQGYTFDTVREFDSVDGSRAKYITETVQFTPLVGWIRITSSKAYDAKGNLIYTLPAGNWRFPDEDIHGNLLPVIVDYIVKNQVRLMTEPSPTVIAFWYTKILTTPSGDTYYFHPGTIVPAGNYIALSVRVEYGREKNGAKSLTQKILIDSVKRKYYPLPEDKSFDINDLQTHSPFSEAVADNFSIRTGTDMGDFLLQVLEYCRQNYLVVSPPFEQSIPRLIPVPMPLYDVYFNPDSIVVRDGRLWVVMAMRSDTNYLTGLWVFRLQDKKTNSAGIREYDLAGKEKVWKGYYSGLQERDWRAIEKDSIAQTLFAAVLAYCRENNIPVEE